MRLAPVLTCWIAACASDPTPCTTAFECSYNGVCSDKRFCSCFPQWQGPHCEQLALIPTPKSAGYQPVIDSSAKPGFRNASTWGGMVIRHDDGVYHMWAAQMTANCGIWAWEQNSMVQHASSSSPYGPFVSKGPAIGLPEAHEPIVARAPTGEYVMWFSTPPGGPGTKGEGKENSGLTHSINVFVFAQLAHPATAEQRLGSKHARTRQAHPRNGGLCSCRHL
jgi:hypothetical protein